MPDRLLRHQAKLLGGVWATGGLPKDEHVAIDVGVDRSLVVRWRSGERACPLGALPLMLACIEDADARAEALRVLAAPLGLDVRVPVDDGADATAHDLVLVLVSATGRLADAISDGCIDEGEAAALTRTADRLEAAAAQLRALVRRGAP